MTESELRTPVSVALTVATAGIVVGVADLPYGYYMLLRLVLCGISLFLLYGARLALADWHRWMLGGWAVLYNPVFPVQLGEKNLWIVLNVAMVAFFWFVHATAMPVQQVEARDRSVVDNPGELSFVEEAEEEEDQDYVESARFGYRASAAQMDPLAKTSGAFIEDAPHVDVKRVVTCPRCRRGLRVPMAGARVRCPDCRYEFLI